MKNDETDEKNNEKLWTDRKKKQWNIMKNRKKKSKMMKQIEKNKDKWWKREKKQWKYIHRIW